ncbi:uncharacterized protein FIBRA_05617 [Fibroporia radiculosa]|uniref:Rab-GAP TBC domain-containing protein n=1 Tax=Fibroporia radiculosa TaxID=599839 RepID=J4G9T7_9APHY|nr:uncharacterized protein FIBRA_05617 [Fibroporia radiculosa]CCM03483.1 predicted protein [Fibroporia radiculosa]
MDATELGRWTRFAAKGGIGRCTALQDCIAEEPDELMFMTDDEITVLMQFTDREDMYLGYCEGVVGRFRGSDVHFHSRLKKPILTKRTSSSGLAPSRSRPTSSQSTMTLVARDTASPPVPLHPSPAPTRASTPRMSHSYSTSSSMLTESSSTNQMSRSFSLGSGSTSSSNQPVEGNSIRIRSTSYSSVGQSSISTALDCAPLTPAPIGLSGGDPVVHVVSVSGQLSSQQVGDTDVATVDSHSDLLTTSPLTISPLKIRKQLSTAVLKDSDDLGSQQSQESYSFDTEDSSQISFAVSDSIHGIGLSLLQELHGNVTSASTSGRPVELTTPTSIPDTSFSTEVDPREPIPEDRPDESMRSDTASVSQYSASPHSVRQPLSEFHPPTPQYARDSVVSRSSSHPSLIGSEYGSAEWEGASDIYDNYRYSRFSVASKMSRLSQTSLAPNRLDANVPPMPSEHQSPRANVDLKSAGLGGQRGATAASHINANASFVDTKAENILPKDVQQILRRPDADTTELMHQNVASKSIIEDRPPSLDLLGNRVPSPLLHTSFGSPQDVMTPLSARSTLSPSLRSPNSAQFSQNEKQDDDEPLEAPSLLIRPSRESFAQIDTSTRLSGQNVVIEDEEDEDFLPSPGFSPVPLPASPLPSSGPVKEQVRTRSPSPEPAPPPYSPVNIVPVERQPSRVPPNQSLPAETQPCQPSTSIPQSRQPGTSIPQSRQSGTSVPQPRQPSASVTQSHQPGASAPQSRQPEAFPQRRQPSSNPPADPSARQSLFMPHPHAPKPAAVPAGPMYGRQPQGVTGAPYHSGPPPESAIQMLNIARAAAERRATTIYGHFEYDLATAPGPVPVSFSLEPQVNVPANRPIMTKARSYSPRPASPATGFGGGGTIYTDRRTESPAPLSPLAGPERADRAIPRPNFSPHAPGMRPRSRSFSGFDAPTREIASSSSSGETPITNLSSVGVITKRSKSATTASVVVGSQLSVPAPQRATVSHAASVVRSVQKPSPLSISTNNTVAPPLMSSSPLSAGGALVMPQFPIAGTSSNPSTPIARNTSFDHTIATQQNRQSPETVRRPSKSTFRSDNSKPSPPPSPRSPTASSSSHHVLRHSRSSILSTSRTVAQAILPRPRVLSQGRPSTDSDVRLSPELSHKFVASTPFSDSPEPFVRTGSSRSRMSSSISRTQSGERPLHPGDRSPVASVFSLEPPHDHTTVSVQDMDFELVRPTVPHSPLAGSSVDSLPLSNSSPVPEAAVPATTKAIAPPIRQPSAEQLQGDRRPPPDVEAHRQRELKWISIMASVPASQSSKSRRVRKLLQEGVPASVRYLVWAHLTDSKAKRMDGLYTRLGQRERVGAIAEIERDSQQIFQDQPLQDQSLVNVLQAYLSMVPDVLYNRGLAVISGQLLLQSPEEDAFWTFVSLMNSHLRPYFSLNSCQLEVDASLFAKVLEGVDGVLAKRIFVDLAIPPTAVCRPWFTTVFADCFPMSYLHRVWDLFLYEGVTFLFRVGLAVASCCRQALLRCKGCDELLAILARPPRRSLPPTPDSFLELAIAAKVRDEDLRKQRSKMEAQVKRQTQSRSSLSSAGHRGSNPPISLPRS